MVWITYVKIEGMDTQAEMSLYRWNEGCYEQTVFINEFPDTNYPQIYRVKRGEPLFVSLRLVLLLCELIWSITRITMGKLPNWNIWVDRSVEECWKALPASLEWGRYSLVTARQLTGASLLLHWHHRSAQLWSDLDQVIKCWWGSSILTPAK
jgi:hypothetical protein